MMINTILNYAITEDTLDGIMEWRDELFKRNNNLCQRHIVLPLMNSIESDILSIDLKLDRIKEIAERKVFHEEDCLQSNVDTYNQSEEAIVDSTKVYIDIDDNIEDSMNELNKLLKVHYEDGKEVESPRKPSFFSKRRRPN